MLQYAQQECNSESVTPENIDSTEMECASECDRRVNLQRIEDILRSLDPMELRTLLRVLMTKRPAFCQALGNLGANVMVVWIQKHSGENLVQQEAIGRHVDQLRDEISEIGDGPLERIVTQQLLITQVQMCYFSGMIAQAGTEHLPTLRYLGLQLDSTTRRMCYLARNLERLRKGRSARPSPPRNATVTTAPHINHLAELLTA